MSPPPGQSDARLSLQGCSGQRSCRVDSGKEIHIPFTRPYPMQTLLNDSDKLEFRRSGFCLQREPTTKGYLILDWLSKVPEYGDLRLNAVGERFRR